MFCNKNCKLIILEIPPISINQWNLERSTNKQEEISDLELNEQIEKVNDQIRFFNSEILDTHSPRLGLDLEFSRKKKNKPARKSINYKLLKDGIHPGNELSQLWMFRLLITSTDYIA